MNFGPVSVRCPVCGRLIVTMWREFWTYKRCETLYCCEDCLLVDLTRDMKLINEVKRKRKEAKQVNKATTNKRNKMNAEEMLKAVRMWREGDSGLDQFLKDHGITNVSKWKSNAKARYGMEEEQKIELVYDPSIAEEYREEQEAKRQREANEKAKDEAMKRTTKILGQEPLEVTELKSRVIMDGFYRRTRDGKGMFLEGESLNGEQLGLTAEKWIRFSGEILLAMEQLGVEEKMP